MPSHYVPNAKFVFKHGPTPWDEIADCNVVIVQRLGTKQNLQALFGLKARGFKIGYDLDDDFWSIQGSNPAKQILGPMKAGFEACAEHCDIITVSTNPLKTAVKTAMKNLNKEIVVIENRIDFNLFRKVPIDKDPDKVTVCWSGSSTHAADLQLIWEVLPEVLETESKMYLDVRGMPIPEKLKCHPRVRNLGWIPVKEYPSRFMCWNYDIILAPLDDSRFNKSKSSIRLIEAGAVEACCLASPVRPYTDFLDKVPSGDFLLCNFKSDWKKKLKLLINESELRKEYGKKLYSTVVKYYDVKQSAREWVKVIESLI